MHSTSEKEKEEGSDQRISIARDLLSRENLYENSIAVAIRSFDPSLFTQLIPSGHLIVIRSLDSQRLTLQNSRVILGKMIVE